MASGDFLDLAQRAGYMAQRDITLAADLTRAKEAVNEAYLHICDGAVQYDFLTKQGTQAMTVGQEAYTYTTIGTSLGVTVGRVIGLGAGVTATNQGDVPDLHYAAWEDYWAIKALNIALGNGTPSIWTVTEDSSVNVWPKPSATTALTVLALQLPAEMTVDSSVPLIPLQWRHRALLPYAAYLLLKQEGGAEAAQEADRLYADYMAAVELMRKAHELPGPLPAPTPTQTLLPSALRGTAGSLLDLAQRTCYLAGLKPWDAHSLTRAKEAVTECYQRIVDDGTRWDWVESEGTFSTAAATEAYAYTAINAACTDVYMVQNATTNQVLSYLDYKDFRRVTQVGGALTGTPEIWTKRGDASVLLYPIPTGIASMRALFNIGNATFTSDTNTTNMPTHWAQRLLPACAAIRVMEQYGAPAEGDIDRIKAEYEQDYNMFKQAHGKIEEFFPEPLRTFVLPTSMRGASGTFLALAQEACRAAGLDMWNQYDMDRAKQFINEAYMAVCDSGDSWRFLEKEAQFTTVNGSDLYLYSDISTAISLAGTITEVFALVNDTEGRQLPTQDWESAERYMYSTQDNEPASVPRLWVPFDDRLRLVPEPDAAYVMGIYFKYRPNEMSANSDTPAVPLAWRSRILVPYAASNLMREKPEQSRIAESLMMQWEQRMAQFRVAYASAKHPRVGLDDMNWQRNINAEIGIDHWTYD